MQALFKRGDKVIFKSSKVGKIYYIVRDTRFVANFYNQYTKESYDTWVVNFDTDTDIPQDVLKHATNTKDFLPASVLEPILKAEIELVRGNRIN